MNLEHVLPQNPKPGDWPQFKEEEAKANCKRIGNLTLLRTGENEKAGSRAFKTKKPAYAASKLQLNKSIAACNTWTESEISTRQAELAKLAITTWSLKP